MNEEHLTCPECGYDLFGIPEERCPECGFGFDHAALRTIGNTTEFDRWIAGRTVIRRAIVAAALILPLVTEDLIVSAGAHSILSTIIYIAAFAVWVVTTDTHRNPGEWATALTTFLIIAVVLLRAATSFPGWIRWMATLFLAWAWFVRIVDWPILHRPHDAQPTQRRRSADRASMIANLTLASASLIILLEWIK